MSSFEQTIGDVFDEDFDDYSYDDDWCETTDDDVRFWKRTVERQLDEVHLEVTYVYVLRDGGRARIYDSFVEVMDLPF
jgi:hypothetical protein